MMSFDAEEMLLLLSIRSNKSSPFVIDYFSFSEVGKLISQAIKEEYILEIRKNFKITQKGIYFINYANNELNRKGIDRAIARLPKYYFDNTISDSIYLPDDNINL